MSATTYSGFVIETNATFSAVITYYQSDGVTAVNLSGYTAEMQIAPSVLLLTTGNGYITLGGSAGTITLSVPLSITENLTPGTYAYDLILIDGSVQTRLICGEVSIVEGITP